MSIGPWVNVPVAKQHTCVVVDCIAKGEPRVCPYDGCLHHHGCIHYDCPAAEATNHGLTFRKGWALVCDMHYEILLAAQRKAQP